MTGCPRGTTLHFVAVPSILLSAFILYGWPGIALRYTRPPPGGATSHSANVPFVDVGGVGRALAADTALGEGGGPVLQELPETKVTPGGQNLNNTGPSIVVQKQVASKPSIQPPQIGQQKPVKVLLFTYMRSGSTLLGELFNQNPDVFYMFEPLAGIYPQLYGISYFGGAQPIDVFFHANGSRREYFPQEADMIFNFIKDVFNCSTDRLPLYTRVAPFLFVFDHYKLKQSYLPCLNHLLPPLQRSGQKPGDKPLQPSYRNLLRNCQSLLPGCTPFPYNRDHEVCRERIQSRQNSLMYPRSRFDKYGSCMANIETLASQCTGQLNKDCRNSSIFVMKTIRLDMHMVRHILEEDPDVKVVYSTRDPRGIENSRIYTKTLSRLSRGNAVTDAQLLCRKMMEDLDLMEELKKQYPDTFLQIRYEDMVLTPQKLLEQLYAHLGIPVPKRVQDWLYAHTHAPRDMGSAYDTMRKDPSKTASKWKRVLKTELKGGITRACMDLLKRLDYDPSY